MLFVRQMNSVISSKGRKMTTKSGKKNDAIQCSFSAYAV